MNHTTPRTSSRTSLSARIALRLVVGAVAFLALGGPSPGYIGGCSRTTTPPDSFQFCAYRAASECARDFRAGRLTGEMFEACYANATPSCVGSQWREGCVPTENIIARCYGALADESRDATLNPDIVECQQAALCGSATGALIVDPHGI